MTDWRRLRLALAMLASVFVLGTIGYVILGFSVLDAVYQTVTTVATVGFREVQPLDDAGKVFTIVLILVGVGTALYTFSVVLETLFEGHLRALFGRRRMERQIETMHGHVIVCGWGRVGRAIADELTAANTDLVVIDLDPTRVAEATLPAMVGDATEDRVLEAAGLLRARALVAALDRLTPGTCSSRSALVPCAPICSSSLGRASRRARRSCAVPAPIASSTRRASVVLGSQRSCCSRTSRSSSTS